MASKQNIVLTKIRRICLSLPDTVETPTWGKPHFRVIDKIFAGFGDEGGKPEVGFKLEKPHAKMILKDPRFRPAPYVGKHGWVTMDASNIIDWDEVRGFILESYRLIAPKKSLKLLESGMNEKSAPTKMMSTRQARRGTRKVVRKEGNQS